MLNNKNNVITNNINNILHNGSLKINMDNDLHLFCDEHVKRFLIKSHLDIFFGEV